MKTLVKVWTLSWDTNNGTNCRVFGSESEWLSFFKEIILQDLAGLETPSALKIRHLLSEDAIGDAYDLWQQDHKDELDTYNWSCDEIEVELEKDAAGLTA